MEGAVMNRRSSMLRKVEHYLAYRRNLGYQLRYEGQLLRQFSAYADNIKHRGPLTVELALCWARLPAGGARLYWARRLEIVRCFARYLAIFEPDTEIPGRQLLGPAHCRNVPHVYSDAEVSALLTGARHLKPIDGLRPHTYTTLIGLLVCTGMRISEALRLRKDNFDDRGGVLIIRETKFNKSRMVPLNPSALAVLLNYAQDRDRLAPSERTDHFFLSDRGTPLCYSTVRGVFRKLVDSIPIRGRGARSRPRIHDLRHTFTCRRVQSWYDAGVDVAQALPALSVYLGHAKVSDTYWYLTATPELLDRAAVRFEPFAGSRHEGDRS
jgi:integrase